MRAYLLIIVFLVITNTRAQLPHTFTQTACNTHYGEAHGVAVDSNGTVFLANGDSGLSAYNYSGYTATANQIFKIPVKHKLLQNYPYSFNTSTTIKFTLPKAEYVSPKIYDLLGQVVATLVSEKLTPENYKYAWDASGFASGIYYYKIKSRDFVQTKKLLLIK